jgi:hypothetical protein
VPSLVADSLVRSEEQPQDVIAGAERAVEAAEQLASPDPMKPLDPMTPLEAVELIGCPVCGANVPVAEARDHEHFRVRTDEGTGVPA